VSEAACINHAHRLTLLSCAACDVPVCADCVRHTQVGTRCLPCAGLAVSPAGASPSHDIYLRALAGVLALALLSPLLSAVAAFVIAHVALLRRPEPAARLLRWATMLFCGVLLVAISVLSASAEGQRDRRLADLDVSLITAVGLAAAAGGAIVLLILAARRCVPALRAAGRHGLAGAITAGTITGALTLGGLAGTLLIAAQ
jgi:hypothetical protein